MERYSVCERPGHQVALPWLGTEKDNIQQILALARNSVHKRYDVSVRSLRLVSAHWRHLVSFGEEYAVSFSTADSTYTARVYRPLTAPSVRVERTARTARKLVYFVVPVLGRAEALNHFLENFANLLQEDSAIRLLLVCHDNDCDHVSSALSSFPSLSSTVSLLRHSVGASGAFSRGDALLAGARHLWHTSAANDAAHNSSASRLLFFCDVDIAVSAPAVQRCRDFTQQGRSVYFPIVFSEYNPALVGDLSEQRVRDWHEDVPLAASNGHWRHYGFGMSCQHASDLLAVVRGVGGAGLRGSGWGGEDVHLYTGYLSRLHVVRVLEPHLRHVYHVKRCDAGGAGSGQYKSCVMSQIVNEGSKEQLGLMALTCSGQLSPRAHSIFRRAWHHVPENWMALLLIPSLLLNIGLLFFFRRKSQQSHSKVRRLTS